MEAAFFVSMYFYLFWMELWARISASKANFSSPLPQVSETTHCSFNEWGHSVSPLPPQYFLRPLLHLVTKLDLPLTIALQ